MLDSMSLVDRLRRYRLKHAGFVAPSCSNSNTADAARDRDMAVQGSLVSPAKSSRVFPGTSCRYLQTDQSGSDSDSIHPVLSDNARFKIRKLALSLSDASSKVEDLDVSSHCPKVCEVWVRPIRSAVARRWDSLHRRGLLRPWRMDSGCTQMGTCFLSAKLMGIPLWSEASASEMKECARDFLVANVPECRYVWRSLRQQTENAGRCYRSGRVLRDMPPRMRRDVFVIGPPCQPYSSGRDHKDDRAELGCMSHGGYETTFGAKPHQKKPENGSLVDLVEADPPETLVVENSFDFNLPDQKTGNIPSHDLVRRLRLIKVNGKEHYVAFHIFIMDSKYWINQTRHRIIACCIT
jgi:hypothetical protein